MVPLREFADFKACFADLRMHAVVAVESCLCRIILVCRQVTANTVGLEAYSQKLPVFAMDASVIAFLQGTTLLTGLAGSLVLQRKLQARPWSQFLPQLCVSALLFTELWYLIVQ